MGHRLRADAIKTFCLGLPSDRSWAVQIEAREVVVKFTPFYRRDPQITLYYRFGKHSPAAAADDSPPLEQETGGDEHGHNGVGESGVPGGGLKATCFLGPSR